MFVKLIFFSLILNTLFGCATMQPSDFHGTKPKLLIENYSNEFFTERIQKINVTSVEKIFICPECAYETSS